MSDQRSQRARRLSALIGNPIGLRSRLALAVSGAFTRVYDTALLAVDRLTSVIGAPLHDIVAARDTERIDVLVCIHRFQVENSSDKSIEQYTLEDTLVRYASNRLRVAFHYWDRDQPLLASGFWFYRHVMSQQPKCVVLSSYTPGAFYQPMPWLLARLKKKGIRFVALWWDTCWDGFAKSIAPVVSTVDVHGIMENPALNLGNSPEAALLSPNAKPLFCAYDFVIDGQRRVIDVAFLGQVGEHRGVRKGYLDFLLEHNVSLYYSAFDRNHQCSSQKYFEILSRAKIGLNFTMSHNQSQLKARVFETMRCGSLLLEERNSQTALLFTENVDYLAFASPEELLEKIRYCLAHEDHRARIAKAGQDKVQRLFGGEQFWDAVLGEGPGQVSDCPNA